MPAYLVQIPEDIPAKNLIGGGDAFVVFAADEANAKAVAASKFAGDANTQIIDLATVTEIVAGADLEGYKLRVAILDSTPVVDLTVTGGPAADISDLANLMVIALNAESIIAGASYLAPLLTIAAGSDNLGDRTVVVEVYGPDAVFDDPQPLPQYIGSITDQGAVGDALLAGLDQLDAPVAEYGAFKIK